MASSSTGSTSSLGKRRRNAKAESNPYYQERRAQLVAAAAELFREKGFKETSLDDIAKLAGTDRSSIYYYVADKYDLFFEVVTKAMEAIAAKVEEIAGQDIPPEERLFQVIRAIMESYITNYPSLYVYVQERLSKATDSRQASHLAKLNKTIDQAIVGLIEQGRAEGVFHKDVPTRLAVNAILGIVNWSHRWYRPDGAYTAAQICDSLATMALNSLAVKPAPSGRARK